MAVGDIDNLSLITLITPDGAREAGGVPADGRLQGIESSMERVR